MSDSPAPPLPSPVLRGPGEAAALAVELVRPSACGVVALLLDDSRWPISSVVVTSAGTPRALVEVADLIVEAAADAPQVANVVMIAVRAGSTGVEPGDLDALFEMSDAFDTLGVALIDLVVVTTDLVVPLMAAGGLGSRW